MEFHMSKKARQLAVQKFNSAATESVTPYMRPSIGGYSASFHRNTEASGGWLVATDSTGPNSSETFYIEITDAQVDEADAVEFDPYNDATYASALLKISDRIRELS
jgi:uncharacterized lipoprotein YmbA